MWSVFGESSFPGFVDGCLLIVLLHGEEGGRKRKKEGENEGERKKEKERGRRERRKEREHFLVSLLIKTLNSSRGPHPHDL